MLFKKTIIPIITIVGSSRINFGKEKAACCVQPAQIFNRKWGGMPTCEALFPLVNPADNITSKRIFDILGFVEEIYENEIALRPPSTDVDTPEGRMHRRKLLRAWVEISAWVVDFRRIFGIITFVLFLSCPNEFGSLASHFKLSGQKSHALHVQLASAREMYQTAIGAHPDQSGQPFCFV